MEKVSFLMLRYDPFCKLLQIATENPFNIVFVATLTREKAYIISCNADINQFIKATLFVLMVSNILGYMELKRLHNVPQSWSGLAQ